MILRRFPDSKRPEDFSCFHRENVLVCAKSSDATYSEHTAPLSIKTCLQGKEIYELNGVPIAVEAGKYLVVNDDQRYASYLLSNQQVETFCLFFEDRLVNQVLVSLEHTNEKLLENPATLAPTPLFQNLRSSDSVISHLMSNLQKVIKQTTPTQMWLDEYSAWLMEVLLSEHRQTLKEVEKLPFIRPTTRIEIYKRLNLAKDYLESCYDEPLTLKKLAQIACLSPHHFLRLFKSAFHQTPHQYLTEVRLQKAWQMAKENKSSITDICFAVGFENLSSFSRLFKNRFHLSPTKLQENKRK